MPRPKPMPPEEVRELIRILLAMRPSPLAMYLAALSKGKKKTLTEAERARRRAALAKVRKFRWADKKP